MMLLYCLFGVFKIRFCLHILESISDSVLKQKIPKDFFFFQFLLSCISFRVMNFLKMKS